MTSANTYYYDLLGKEQKNAYHAILTGLMSLAPSFPVPRLSGKELADLYFLVRLDHPDIFWSVRYTYRYYPDSENVEMVPEYLFPKSKIREHQLALTSRVRKLARPAENLHTEQEKELYIHDFVLNHIHYDKLKKPYSHEIIGSLGNGVAVCEGIAKAVKVLCDTLQIWCIIAVSDNNPEKGIRYRHTWNVIRIGKNYYHLDATFDNSLTNGPADRSSAVKILRYDYVNLPDRQVYIDHEPSIYPLPPCPDAGHTWFRENKLSFTKIEDLRKRAVSVVRKKKPFVFQWRGGYLTREILMEIVQSFQEESRKKEQRPVFSVNWTQAVIAVHFSEIQPEQEIELEQVNEGELYRENE